MAVLLSDQDPDAPDYCEAWTSRADLSSRPTWGHIVRAMAEVCLYSDVVDYLTRCHDCHSRGYNYGDDGEEVDCETCGGAGTFSLDTLATTPRPDVMGVA